MTHPLAELDAAERARQFADDDCNPQLEVAPTHETYARAAALLWGDAGEFAAAEFGRHNRDLFAGSVAPVPIIIGLAAYGHCLGLTRHQVVMSPRISLAPEIFTGSARTRGGRRMVSDVVLHEMIHVALFQRGESPQHNDSPWCKLIAELSPDVLGTEICARPVRTHRVPNPDREADPSAPKTIVRRIPDPGAMTQAELARWPQSLRPAGWYDSDSPIYVPAY